MQILSINRANRPGPFYREVWIGLGGTHSAVYATEVSAEEYTVYTTEESEKLELHELTRELGGNLELAVRRLAEGKERNKNKYQPLNERSYEKQTIGEAGGMPGRHGRHGILKSCMEANGTDCDRLCGSWSSVEGKPDVLVYKEGGAYKVTVFSRSGKTRVLKPRTYLGGRTGENSNLFINTGYRIDVSYNEATDVLTFLPR